MVVFSWVMFVISALLGASSLGSFLLFIFLDINAWLDRARSLRRGLYMALLLWFNVFVWGRVVMTLIHW
jgi:hypothetical protein